MYNTAMNDREVGPAEAIGSLLGAAHALEDRVETALASVGLSGAKLGVLTHLANAGEPITLGELAARVNCVRSNVTQLVDRLEADGLVRRVDNAKDRRSVRAELTPEGKARYKAGTKQMEKVHEEFAASMPAAERAALRRALSLLK